MAEASCGPSRDCEPAWVTARFRLAGCGKGAPAMLMRPATAADIPAVAALIYSRCLWLEERGWPSWRDNAEDVASQAENTDGSVWLLDDAGTIVGCTTVQEHAPPWGWTREQLAEPAHYLYTTVTDPAYQAAKPGTLIAWWAVDRAAREGKAWVRRGCFFPGLVRYYERQGFTLYHEVQRTRRTVFLMGRRAEQIPGLDRMFTEGAVQMGLWVQ